MGNLIFLFFFVVVVIFITADSYLEKKEENSNIDFQALSTLSKVCFKSSANVIKMVKPEVVLIYWYNEKKYYTGLRLLVLENKPVLLHSDPSCHH